jgi:hypothetical protein
MPLVQKLLECGNLQYLGAICEFMRRKVHFAKGALAD